MKKPSAFLSLVQRYSKLFTWISIYATFFVSSVSHQTTYVAFLITSMTFVPMVLVWAFLNYYLIPRTLHKHRIIFFLSCAIFLEIICLIAAEFDLYQYTRLYQEGLLEVPHEMKLRFSQGTSQRPLFHSKYAVLLITTSAITTISWLLNERKQQNQLQREHRARLELKYLRAQINPHFLFNALNCIYSLSLTQDEKTPDSIMKISDMLRYVVDDCKSELVPIQKEVSYIQNYIDFQLIRMEQRADISFDHRLSSPSAKIPPMIFQPMVENCFKHSRIVDHPDGFVHLKLEQTEHEITFIAENSKPLGASMLEDQERTGIGLQNVQQRLAILYKENAQMQIEDSDNKYSIRICIKY